MRPPPRGRHRASPASRIAPAWRAVLAAATSLATASLVALAAVQVAPTGRLRDATAGPSAFGRHAEAVRPPTRSIGPLAIPSIGVVPTGALTPFDPGKAPEDVAVPTLVDLPQTAATRACRCEPRSLPSIAATSSTAAATTPAPRSTATSTAPPATATVPATTTPAATTAVPSTTAPSTTTEDVAATTQVASSLTATATEEMTTSP